MAFDAFTTPFTDDFDDDAVGVDHHHDRTITCTPFKHPLHFLSLCIVQCCVKNKFRWVQVALEHSLSVGKWAFPKVPVDSEERDDDDAIDNAIAQCAIRLHRRLLSSYVPVFNLHEVVNRPAHMLLKQGRRSLLAVYFVRDMLSPPLASITSSSSSSSAYPNAIWAVESEMCDHRLVGPPSIFGLPVCPFTVAAWQSLPLEAQFASPRPPLVLYHGTGVSFLKSILHTGLRPGSQSFESMLGAGIYLARFEKAKDFAEHTVDNIQRLEPGVVLRTLVMGAGAPAAVRELTAEDHCLCGCARAFVDHTDFYGRGFGVVAVPDNAGSATRRAEWCVKNRDLLVILGVFYHRR